jgi:FAD:protein FMN transferase
MRQIVFRAMGCEMSAFIDNDRIDSTRMLAQLPVWFEAWEQCLSRFRPESELTQFNKTSGAFQPVSPVLWDVVQAALQAAQETDGLVTPTILKFLEWAGYDQTFEKMINQTGRQTASDPQPQVQRLNREEPTWQDIRMDHSTRSVFLPHGMKLDLGGVAKGWAAHQAMLRLQENGPALMNAGGDISVSGPRESGDPWPVAIADPHKVNDNLGILSLGTCGVATSGIDYRRWLNKDRWNHHIIDPKTGQSAQTDLLTVTVIAPNVLQAEAAAKAILILGSQDGLQWLEERPFMSGVLAQQNGQVIYSSQLNYVWS